MTVTIIHKDEAITVLEGVYKIYKYPLFIWFFSRPHKMSNIRRFKRSSIFKISIKDI